jgi:hypothetical protein
MPDDAGGQVTELLQNWKKGDEKPSMISCPWSTTSSGV